MFLRSLCILGLCILGTACGRAGTGLQVPALPTPAPSTDDAPTDLAIRALGAGQMELRFHAPRASRVYQIQYKSDLTLPEWKNIPSSDGGLLISSQDNQLLIFTDAHATDPIRFYRVKVLGGI